MGRRRTATGSWPRRATCCRSWERPTGGSRWPRDWFYSNYGTPSGWVWTFSAQDPKAGEYETGVRIQMFVQVEEKLKRSRESFASGFLEQRRESANVLKDCPVQDFGSFKRQCLEVLEDIAEPSGKKQFHILYTVM
jgi:hypothetical protein